MRNAGSLLLATLGLALGSVASEKPESAATVFLVVGAPGEKEFGEQFDAWAANWRQAAHQAGARLVAIGCDEIDSAPDEGNGEIPESETPTDRRRFEEALVAEFKSSPRELWLVLIGHGTFDGKTARFNLRGPDFSAEELHSWLADFDRPIAVINGSSASGPFINRLSVANRVIVTATRSGFELNYSRFGGFLSGAMLDVSADLDKDGQVSLLEAFLIASRRVQEFYETEGRLATEHALLDDNGDGLGTPADWFRGVRAVKKAKDGAAVDGVRAHQFHLIRSQTERDMAPTLRARRDELELAVARLREQKPKLSDDEYYKQLEAFLVELARLYESFETGQTDALER